MGHAFLLTVLAMTGVPVDVRPLAGSAISGELLEITAQGIVVQTPGGRQDLALSGLWEVTPSKPGAVPREMPLAWVDLTDGSQLLAMHYTTSSGVAAVMLTSGEAISVPTSAIHAVRFRDHAQTPELAKQWSEIVAQKLDADAVIVRRSNSLDQLDGVIRDVTADAVRFEFNGQRIDVNRKKLDGLAYYHPTAPGARQRLCQVTDITGSQWNVKTVRLVDRRLELVTAAGVAAALPIAHVTKLDFSGGNLVWLSDLEPESLSWQPFIDSQLPAASLAKLFQPRRNRSFSGEPLLLGGTEYPRGLALRSRTELVYRLADQFRQFHAVIGIDDRVRDSGNVVVVISGDQRVLFSKPITGHDPPLPVDLDVTGAKRLKILVDFGQELDLGDLLHLCDARLTK